MQESRTDELLRGMEVPKPLMFVTPARHSLPVTLKNLFLDELRVEHRSEYFTHLEALTLVSSRRYRSFLNAAEVLG